jgi:dolichol-phosphate mannosyltransferase
MTQQNNINVDSKPLISIVIPCFNEVEVFPALRNELVLLADRLSERYRIEFILIDDGSHDGTWKQILDFAQADSRVRAISLSRNFGHQNALTCGYDFAKGDAIVSMDADLQDPPEVIVDLVNEWEKGADIVYAVRVERQRETLFKKLSAKIFYRLFQILTKSLAPANVGDFRLISKQVLFEFRRFHELHRYIRGMVGWMGFLTAQVQYQRKPRVSGTTKYPFRRMLRLALDAIVSFSFMPLRLAYCFAISASFIVFGYLIFVLARYFLFGVPVAAGWTSLIMAITIFGFCNLFCIGIIGEYVGRIYEQTKQRPLYLIREIINEQHAGKTQ